jgi:hypothetical protein
MRLGALDTCVHKLLFKIGKHVFAARPNTKFAPEVLSLKNGLDCHAEKLRLVQDYQDD